MKRAGVLLLMILALFAALAALRWWRTLPETYAPLPAPGTSTPSSVEGQLSQTDEKEVHPVNIPLGPMAPDIVSDTWLNSPPLTPSDLRGHVVLVEFWTFG